MKKKNICLITSVLVISVIIFGTVKYKSISKTNDQTTSIQSEEIQKEADTYSEENEMTIDLGDGVSMDFVYIKPGEYQMGSNDSEEDEYPKHTVKITKPFYMSKYEVTQEQWEKVTGYNNSIFKDEKNPVENVSYTECKEFLNKLSFLTKKEYSLPTEAQWEYACRAGTDTTWYFGDNEKDADEYAWITSNSGQVTHNVGTKKPNEWGLYDMYGNVQEWCSDWYEDHYSAQNELNPSGPKKGESRVIRGGAWGDAATSARSSYRNVNGEDGKNDGTGMRCVININ